MLVLLGAAFLGALVMGGGSLSALTALRGEQPHNGVVEAGSFEFTYPAGWDKMPGRKLPKQAIDASLPGAVVAGLCTSAHAGKDCTKSVDVNYVLFQEGHAFPALAALETSFDRALPRQFAKFHKEHAALRRTADGMQYLSYEFTFKRGGQKRREVVAAYKRDGKGLIVVATGPEAEFVEQRGKIRDMLDAATAKTGGAH